MNMTFSKYVTCVCRVVLTVAFMAIFVSASAKELVIALGGPIETAQGQGLQKFAQRIKELTNGELTAKLFPDGQLGGNAEAFEQIQGGQVDLTPVPPGVIAEFLPEMQALVVPFVFRDYTHWKKVTSGPIAERLSQIASEKADVKIIGYFGGSVRNLLSRKEIKSEADFQYLRIRLHPSEVQISAWRSLGILPTVISYGEIYNALQLGVIDGLENEPEWVTRMKFYEQAKYYAITAHEIVTRPLIFSKNTFDSLSSTHQKAVIQAGADAVAFQTQLENSLDAKFREELANKHGVAIVNVDGEKIRRTVGEALEKAISSQGLEGIVSEIKAN